MAVLTSRVEPTCTAVRIEDSQEDSLYHSPLYCIREETDYIRKIRSALDKIQRQVFGDELDGCNRWKMGSKTNSSGDLMTNSTLYVRHHQILQDLHTKELQLSHILMENQELEIKLEATREAGVTSLRNAAKRLFETYESQAEEMRVKHGQEKETMQSCAAELEQDLRQRLENLQNLEISLQGKQERVSELEKLVGRMEQEKAVLTKKKKLIEHETRWRPALPQSPVSNVESLRSRKTEANSLQEKIHHLNDMILSQNRKLRSYIQQIQQLNKELSDQDNAVWTLTESLHSAEAKLLHDGIQIPSFKDNVLCTKWLKSSNWSV
ncbi:coiled-coil domain-containing protein 68 isoform X2 [Amia ocellicauda]|uniref:coiled-coil domain-containing protein 68 isoform X2 n=1 Tax=Amia ocellicauda TaxID=2972642 RepID=UPI003464A341